MLRHARDIVALPFVNSGEQAAELPDLVGGQRQKLGRENGNVSKNRIGFQKSMYAYRGCALLILDRLVNIGLCRAGITSKNGVCIVMYLVLAGFAALVITYHF